MNASKMKLLIAFAGKHPKVLVRRSIALSLPVAAGLGLGSAFTIQPQDSAVTPVRARAVNLVSTDLPSDDRQRILRSFTGKSYVPEELRVRIVLLLENDGYFRAVVDHPKLTNISMGAGESVASLSFPVSCGPQYHLEAIRFHPANAGDRPVFPVSQLRSQFRINDNAVFDESSISRGFESLRKLYLDHGYADFVAIPQFKVNEPQHGIAVVVEIDRGSPFSFGRLFLDGIEPHTGDAARLLFAWRKMQGRTYSPEVLHTWVAQYAPSSTCAGAKACTSSIQHEQSRTIDVRLQFPWARDQASGQSASSD